MKIGTRILIMILAVTLLSLASVYFSTFHLVRSLRAEINRTIGDSTRDAAALLSDNQRQAVKQHLMHVVTGNANFMDACLDDWRRQTDMFAALATEIFTNPERYRPRSILPPRRGAEGITPQLLYSRSNIDPAAVADEAGMAGGILDYMLSLFKHSPVVNNASLAVESGFIIDFDDLADRKFADPEALEPEPFDAQSRPWYVRTKVKNAFNFSNAYHDFFTNELVVSGAAPVYRNGGFHGVACLAFLLRTLEDTVLKTSLGQTGYGFIFDEFGKVFISPKKSGDTATDASLLSAENAGLAEVVDGILSAEGQGVVETVIDGRDTYLAYYPLTTHSWYFATAVDKEEMDVLAHALERELDGMSGGIRSTISDKLNRFRVVFLGLTGLGLLLAFFASKLAVSWFSRPLRNLTDGAERIGSGELDVTLPAGGKDELGVLARTFNKMTDDLKKQMNELARIAAEKQRISTELEVANQIQTNMLPSAFPPLHGFEPGIAYDIFATMKPAKEVGGDMYDFFVIDRHRLGLVIGDVCGKGIPAALFMVVVKTLIKNQALQCKDPAKVFETVNNQLCADNYSAMFSTALFAVFDFETLELTFANAGHPPPLIRRSNGEFEPCLISNGPPLGALPDMEYGAKSESLEGGATLFFYTDGVTEAQDEDERLYSDGSLLELLRTRVKADALPRDIVMLVEEEVIRFTGNREAYDDMTMLVFTVKPTTHV